MVLGREYKSGAILHEGWKSPLIPLCFKFLLRTGGDILILLERVTF